MKPYRTTVLTIALMGAILAAPVCAKPLADPLAPAGHWQGHDAGAAKTPPMGWNSWNAFHTDVDEAKVLGAAHILVDSGLAKLGYSYVNLDDGWWLKRRTSDGRMQMRTNIFPSAATGGANETSFKPFTDTLHGMGLKAGIYTDIGRNACSQAYDLHSPNLPQGTTAEREVGLDGHVKQDIGLYFGEWGFDYIKIDACGLADYAPGSDLVKQQAYRGLTPEIERNAINRTDIAAVRGRYEAVAQALKATNPDNDYVLSICNWGMANVRTWGKDTGNAWRTSADITPGWSSMLHNYDSAAKRALYAGPGHWNDPDILFIGQGEFDTNHLTEARAHFSLWSMLDAPLLISYDLRQASPDLMAILGNVDIIALDQDPAGNQATVAYDSDNAQILVKTLGDGSHKAVALVNRGAAPVAVTLLASHLRYAEGAPVVLKDLWSKDSHSFTGEETLTLVPHETRVFDATGQRELKGGLYLSEMPGAINVAVDGATPQVDPTIHRMIDPWSGTRSGGSRPQYAGWGGAQADTTPYGQTLQIAGQAFGSGIGVLANSRLQVKNDGFATFTASVGVDDSTEVTDRPVQVFVYGDGKLLAQTPLIKFGDKARTVSAHIAGKTVIELVVRSAASHDARPVVVTWGEARMLRAGS